MSINDTGIYLINKYKEVDLSDDLKEHIRGMIEIYSQLETLKVSSVP